MNRKTARNTFGPLIVAFLMSGLSGCASMPRWFQLPHNNMCASDTCVPGRCTANVHCSNECSGVYAEIPIAAQGVPVPVLAETSIAAQAELSMLQGQIDALETNGSAVQEQLISLDKSLEEQRVNREAIVNLMQDLSTALSDVRQELGDHKNSVDNVASRINQQRTRNEQLLSDVERQLNDVLAQYRTTSP